MQMSTQLREAVEARGYKTDRGLVRNLKTIINTGDRGLALEAQAVVDYYERLEREDRFKKVVIEAAKVRGTKPSELKREQIKQLRVKFDLEDKQ